MSNKPYKVEDKAKEILNVFKENGIKLEDIDFKVLEKALKKADKKENRNKYIPLCCPHCGTKISLYVNNDKDSEIFKEIYNCTNCGSDLDIKYDIGSRNLNINIELDLE